VEKEPSTWDRVSSFFSSWRTELIKHAKKGVDYFSSNILQSEDSSYSVSLEQLEMLFLGFKKAYYHDGRCWDYKDNKFKEDVSKISFVYMASICSSDEDYVLRVQLLWSSIVCCYP
jgi:hypothetical protein